MNQEMYQVNWMREDDMKEARTIRIFASRRVKHAK